LRRFAAAAFLVAFGTLTAVTNGTRLAPLADARLATRWGMFSAPPRAQPAVVVTQPGGVVLDPNAPDRPWLERLRDVRERKLIDSAARTPAMVESYLDHRCRALGADTRAVQLVARAALGQPERVIAERTCDPSRSGDVAR
jgi:hypothetical protein